MVDQLVGWARDPKQLEQIKRHNASVPAPCAWPEVAEKAYTLYRSAAEVGPDVDRLTA